MKFTDVRLLGKLRKESENDPYRTASALLDHFEGKKFEPIEAMVLSESLTDALAEESKDRFWRETNYALDAIRSEATPDATLYYSNGGSVGERDCPHVISRYVDDTDGDFIAEWHSTDAWRGHNEIKPAPGSNWTEVMDDGILAGSDDANELGSMDELLRSILDETKISYVRAFATSSNLFYQGYQLFVEKDRARQVAQLVDLLRPIYRNAQRFSLTALTGCNPRDARPEDWAISRIGAALLRNRTDPNPSDRMSAREVILSELVDLGWTQERAAEVVEMILGNGEG